MRVHSGEDRDQTNVLSKRVPSSDDKDAETLVENFS